MTKSITFNGKRYNLEQIKKRIEKFWNESFNNIEVKKEFQAVEFSNKSHSVYIPLEDLENYI